MQCCNRSIKIWEAHQRFSKFTTHFEFETHRYRYQQNPILFTMSKALTFLKRGEGNDGGAFTSETTFKGRTWNYFVFSEPLGNNHYGNAVKCRLACIGNDHIHVGISESQMVFSDDLCCCIISPFLCSLSLFNSVCRRAVVCE